MNLKIIKNEKILAIGAHPDDVEYYAGGTLLKLARENSVILSIVTDGGFNGDAVIRKREQEKSAKLMKVSEVIYLNYPDLGLEVNGKMLRTDLLKLVLKTRPDILFSFDPANQFHPHGDFHPDHRLLSLEVIDVVTIYATLPSYIKKIGLKELPLTRKPELWLFDPYSVNHYEDVSHFWLKKLQVLKTFKSQKLDLRKAKDMVEEYGRQLGVNCAEGFNQASFCSKM